MNQLIQIENKNGVDMVSSQSIANELGVEHRATLQVIEKYLQEIEDAFGPVAFEMREFRTAQGNKSTERTAYLTEDQSIFIATLSRNSEKVVQFKTRLVQAFQAARRFIKEVSAPISEEQKILEGYKLLMQKVEVVEEQLKLANSTIQRQAPAVQYHNQVLTSINTYTTTTIAKELGMGAKTLNQKLKELKVQYYHDGHWILYQPHQNKGYTDTRTHTYYDGENKQQTSLQTVWTEKGRQFIHEKLNPGLTNHLQATA